MKDFSFVTSSDPSHIEDLYHQFVDSPETIDPEWQMFFKGFDFASTGASVPNGKTVLPSNLDKEFGVYKMIRAFRKRGHLLSTTNPIRPRKDRHAHLALEDFGLSKEDLNTHFVAGKFMAMENATLAEIRSRLEKVYVGNV